MKKTVITNTTFNPSTKVINTGITNFDIRNLYAIINQTADVILYATGITGKGYTAISGSSITLEYNTVGMNSSDILQIIYDDSEDTDLLQNILEAIDTITFLQQLRTTSNTLRVSVNDATINTSRLNLLDTNTNSGIGTPSPISIGVTPLNLAIHEQNMTAIQSNINNISIT